jgi:ArsR family transcriptional regulator
MVSTSSAVDEAIMLGFRALSDALRWQILDALRDRELCVCDLCDLLQTPQSKLSFHLKVLKDAQLVVSRQQGRWMYYRLNVAQFEVLTAYLQPFQTAIAPRPASPCE